MTSLDLKQPVHQLLLKKAILLTTEVKLNCTKKADALRPSRLKVDRLLQVFITSFNDRNGSRFMKLQVASKNWLHL